jgi:putative spermidine/putrescine transport system ATP-binding protein
MGYLELHNVRKEFANSVAVEDFNLDVARGEFISFLGPSGCGKTTTLRMIAGFEQPTRGAIRINDEDVTNKPASKRHVGMVFQSYALFPHMTAADNIGFGLKIAGKPSSEIKQRVGEMLDVIQMNDFGGRYPHQLSGGQQQRVALARALAIQPSVLLLDEPLSALDAKIRVELREDIRAIQKRLGITAIYVTHDQEEALSLSDRIVVMNKARIEQVGEPFEIYNFPATRWVAGFVGTINLIDGKIVDAHSVSVEGHTLGLASTQNNNPGKAVKLTIRPEAISFSNDRANTLSGEVESVTFLGSVVRVRVRVGDQSLVMDALNNPNHTPPKIGERVSVHVPREAILVLED